VCVKPDSSRVNIQSTMIRKLERQPGVPGPRSSFAERPSKNSEDSTNAYSSCIAKTWILVGNSGCVDGNACTFPTVLSSMTRKTSFRVREELWKIISVFGTPCSSSTDLVLGTKSVLYLISF